MVFNEYKRNHKVYINIRNFQNSNILGQELVLNFFKNSYWKLGQGTWCLKKALGNYWRIYTKYLNFIPNLFKNICIHSYMHNNMHVYVYWCLCMCVSQWLGLYSKQIYLNEHRSLITHGTWLLSREWFSSKPFKFKWMSSLMQLL